jgi:hypothetical protein
VAQRFSAAISALFSPAALAAEVKPCIAKELFSSLLEHEQSSKGSEQ